MSYLIIVFLHILGVIAYVGNIVVGIFWKSFAEKQGTREALKLAFEGITRADKIFTMPGVAIVLVFGIGAAMHVGFDLLTTGWIFWSIIMLIISSIAYMFGVVPAQKKIVALVNDKENFSLEQYKVFARQWDLWGTIAVVAPIIAILLMTLKQPM